MLFARGRLKHTYPHSWRSKKPIIFRNTPQWFVHMDKDLAGFGLGSSPTTAAGGKPDRASAGQAAPAERSRESGDSVSASNDTLSSRALAAIDATRFVPAAGQNRLRGMIADRPDWVLSRQRAWGVPICIFADDHGGILKDEAVNARILEAFEAEGADAWFAAGAKERFLGNDHDPDAWHQVMDILDVWFDSGSTHTFTLEDRPDLKWPADVYLEGSDQHRGWFHSSLLESCATRGRAPYDTVVTHGFTMDEKGEKMSKSKGNTVTPQEVMGSSGADILRLWVMTTDYWRGPAPRQGDHPDQCRRLPQAPEHRPLDARHARPRRRRDGARRSHAGTGAADAPPAGRARPDRAQGLRRFRLQAHIAAPDRLRQYRAFRVLFRHPQGRALLRRPVEPAPQGGACR